ncbi:PAS domain-containing protein [Aestuariibius sp. 2305UL40-4]|uniref:PAS domain-containing sensor histidine kinase n=1 Tax=Aestuariibius violaceus TaxID=3234132 RepID=UPI00345E2709
MDRTTNNCRGAELERLIDAISQIMFLIEVAPDGGFLIRHLNPRHEAFSGLRNADVAGRPAHAALPPRIADAVCDHYATCRDSGKEHIYEELLELPTGAKWYQTTLSPIFDRCGAVRTIVGSAVDISAYKAREFDAVADRARLSGMVDDLRLFSAMAAQDMRGPFQTILGLVGLIKDGFLDLGDEKVGQLQMVEDTASTALRHMEGILRKAESIDLETDTPSDLALDHICREVTGVLDPEGQFAIRFPDATLHADRVALQLILRNLFEVTLRYAQSTVELGVEPDPISGDQLWFTLTDDGIGPASDLRSDGRAIIPRRNAADAHPAMILVRDLVEERDGVLRQLPAPTGRTKIGFSLPGKILSIDAGAEPPGPERRAEPRRAAFSDRPLIAS